MHQSIGGRSDMTVSRCVLAVLKENVIPVPQFVENFLPTVIKYLDHEDEGVVSMWSATLIEAIPLLPIDVLQEHVAPVALERSQPRESRPLNLRIISCNILGDLALQYDPTLLKQYLLPSCLSLCQDENPDVRAAICLQLEKVIKQLRGDSFKTTLGPSLVELGSDESIKVKEAAFITAVNILEFVDQDDILTTLIPLLKRLIHYGFTSDDTILIPIANRFGEMCLGIKKVTHEKQVFVKYFSAITSVGLPPSRRRNSVIVDSDYQIKFPSLVPEQCTLCRQAAAANLPAVVSFCEDDVDLVDELLPLLDSLCSDPSLMVRTTVGSGIVEMMGPLCTRKLLLRNNLIKLLNDDAEEVLEGIIPQLPVLIPPLTETELFGPGVTVPFISELSPALLKCEGLISVSRNWRLYCDFLQQIRILTNSLSQEALYSDYVCLFLKRMHQTRNVPVRAALMEAVLFFIRRIHRTEYRKKTIETIINDFCKSTNFYNRIFYLRSCNLFFNMFSITYFKRHFFASTLSLVDDAVANIRWTLMKLLPKLEYLVSHPPDDMKKKQLDAVKNKLMNDKDKEISRTMNIMNQISNDEDLSCFADDELKYDGESKIGEYVIVVDVSAIKSVIGSRIPRSPSSSTSLASFASLSKPVMRRKQEPSDQTDAKKDTGKERNNNYTIENNHKLQSKSFRRSIPVSSAAKSRSAPSSRQSSFKDKRLSLDEIDMNKNMVVVPGDHFISSQPKPSQLPRPLSCINFPTPPSSYSKKSNSSKLPVSSRSSAVRLGKS